MRDSSSIQASGSQADLNCRAEDSCAVVSNDSRGALDRAVTCASKRLVPYLMLMYVVSFLDRANVSFAKQALQSSVGISESVYAMGAGLFFISYSLCGFPSNLVLRKVGAKFWISFLMVCWGLTSMATMFISGDLSFYVLRFLLGVVEAGFFPGAILYLTYWFPNSVKSEIIGYFYLGVPAALILGGPLSGLLLQIHFRLGLQGWQWMFLVEGFLAVVVGVASFRFLDDNPSHARWLPAGEKQALIATLDKEEEVRRSFGPVRILPMLRDAKVLLFLVIYSLIQLSIYGAVFYLPAEISALILKPEGLEVGLISAAPWICAAVVTWRLPKRADRWNNHRTVVVLALSAAGLAGIAFPHAGPREGILALCVAISGLIVAQPIYWTLPTGYLAGSARAGGVALINVGNLGGFFAPTLKVWADRHFHSSHAGLYILAGAPFLAAALICFTKSTNHVAVDFSRVTKQ
jgi:MFS family permease